MRAALLDHCGSVCHTDEANVCQMAAVMSDVVAEAMLGIKQRFHFGAAVANASKTTFTDEMLAAASVTLLTFTSGLDKRDATHFTVLLAVRSELWQLGEAFGLLSVVEKIHWS